MNPYFQNEFGKLYHADCLEIMPSLSEKFDALITSPPYGVGKEYEDSSYHNWIATIIGAVCESEKILSPGAFSAWVLADVRCHKDPMLPRLMSENIGRRKGPSTRQIIEAISNGCRTKDEICKKFSCSEQTVDRRLKGNNARGTKGDATTRIRFSSPHIEQAASYCGMFVYDQRIWVKDPCWESCQYHSGSYRAVDEYESITILARAGDVIKFDRSRLTKKSWSKWGSRSVWNIPSVRSNDDHPAKYPVELASRLISLLTPNEGIIVDPFAGSGTTALAAESLGRQWVLIEKERKYCEIIAKRLRAKRN